MIEERKTYFVKCDFCGKVLRKFSCNCTFYSKESISKEISKQGWVWADENQWCPECYNKMYI